MIPLLLVLLFMFPLATSSQICHEHSACLHFVTCFDGSAPDSTRTMPTVKALMDFKTAIIEKKKCNEFGFISTLAIVSTSLSSMNFTLETELNFARFTIREETYANLIIFSTNSNGTVKISGLEAVLEHTKHAPIASHGRAIYTFQVEHPEQKPLQAFVGDPIFFSAKNGGGNVIDESVTTEFWNDFKTKLACDVSGFHDTCHGEDCIKAIITAHTVSCEQSGQLQLSLNSGSKLSVDPFLCKDQKWIYPSGTEISSKDKNIFCRAPATTTIPVTSTASPSSPTTSFPPSTTPRVETTTEQKIVVEPDHQKGANETLPSPIRANSETKEEKAPSARNKWLWIGLGGGLLAVVVVVNVVGCMYCRKKNKNDTTRKNSRTGKSPKTPKKKGGKARLNDSSSNQPSTSESKGDPEAKPLKKTPKAKSVCPAVSSDTTVMNLDRLKTEMVD